MNGRIDFSKADLSDRRWWTRLGLILKEQEKENLIKVLTMKLALNTALLDYSNDTKQFTHHWDRSIEIIGQVYNTLYPWNKQPVGKKAVETEYERLIQLWKDTWGDPNDPDVKKKIDYTVDVIMGKVNKWGKTSSHSKPLDIRTFSAAANRK